MKERPILFSGPMVLRLLGDQKTQTRRIIRDDWWRCLDHEDEDDRANAAKQSPYGVPGDRLWVRETFAIESDPFDDDRVIYRADREARWIGTDDKPFYLASDYKPARWSPAIHMPRALSRITLEVTSVRVERLHDITEEDAKAEGVEPLEGVGADQYIAGSWKTHGSHPYTLAYAVLWDTINGDRAPWALNLWVFVVGFRRVQDGDVAPR